MDGELYSKLFKNTLIDGIIYVCMAIHMYVSNVEIHRKKYTGPCMHEMYLRKCVAMYVYYKPLLWYSSTLSLPVATVNHHDT